MGFSSLSVVIGIIGQVYSIQHDIATLERQKFRFSRESMMLQNAFARTNITPADPEYDQQQAIIDAGENELQINEKQIDQQLEQLKAVLTALNQQKEEYQRFVADGIKSTFKNNYV